MVRAGLLLSLCFVAGCSCDEDADLVVEGERGYVRCFAAAAPEPRSWDAAGARMTLDEARRLTIAHDEAPTLVAFAGPVGSLDSVRAAAPDVVIALGDVAPDALARLAELDAVVLVIGGGTDLHAPLAEAFEALDEDAAAKVIDAAVLRSIRIADLELVPVAGAPDGRYAVQNGACGLGEDDLDAWDLDDPDDGVHRVLVSWAAPRGEGRASVSRGLENVEAGSPLIRDLADQVGAEAAVFAWPRTHAGRVEADGTWRARIALRPLSGPAVVRADGTRVGPGPTVVRISSDGLSTSP